ncbi:MAG: class I SAM-dependent methyltransferase [Prochloraceae cyanobacterium]
MELFAGQRIDRTVIDKISIEKSGLIIIQGWDRDFNSKPDLKLLINGENISINEFHRIYRPDVANTLKVQNCFLGFSCEFLIDKSLKNSCLEIILNGQKIISKTVTREISTPAYATLLNESNVKHRDDIYGYGPPAESVAGDILDLVKLSIQTKDKVLDFGCGRGNIVSFLRTRGTEAFGIELETPLIREALLPECKQFIQLYSGNFPLPYQDEEFDRVLAIEVIEHIPEYYQAIQEIHRISKETFIMSVPDASAIPRCFNQNVVPWHLLESTHFNFFTEKSLRNVLSKFWGKITFIKVGQVNINDTGFKNSIVAVCEDKYARV